MDSYGESIICHFKHWCTCVRKTFLSPREAPLFFLPFTLSITLLQGLNLSNHYFKGRCLVSHLPFSHTLSPRVCGVSLELLGMPWLLDIRSPDGEMSVAGNINHISAFRRVFSWDRLSFFKFSKDQKAPRKRVIMKDFCHPTDPVMNSLGPCPLLLYNGII